MLLFPYMRAQHFIQTQTFSTHHAHFYFTFGMIYMFVCTDKGPLSTVYILQIQMYHIFVVIEIHYEQTKGKKIMLYAID